MGSIDDSLIVVAGELVQAPECRILVQAGPLHQDSLGALDDLAVGEGLTQLAGLLPQGLELIEPLHGQADRHLQVGLLDRLDEIGEDLLTLGPFDELAGRDRPTPGSPGSARSARSR